MTTIDPVTVFTKARGYPPPKEKTCRICFRRKTITEFAFFTSHNKGKKPIVRFSSYCKPCLRANTTVIKRNQREADRLPIKRLMIACRYEPVELDNLKFVTGMSYPERIVPKPMYYRMGFSGRGKSPP